MGWSVCFSNTPGLMNRSPYHPANASRSVDDSGAGGDDAPAPRSPPKEKKKKKEKKEWKESKLGNMVQSLIDQWEN